MTNMYLWFTSIPVVSQEEIIFAAREIETIKCEYIKHDHDKTLWAGWKNEQIQHTQTQKRSMWLKQEKVLSCEWNQEAVYGLLRGHEEHLLHLIFGNLCLWAEGRMSNSLKRGWSRFVLTSLTWQCCSALTCFHQYQWEGGGWFCHVSVKEQHQLYCPQIYLASSENTVSVAFSCISPQLSHQISFLWYLYWQ